MNGEQKTQHLKRRVYEVLEVAKPGDQLSRAFDIFIVTLIALNVVAFVLESVASIHSLAPRLFRGFDVVSVAIFSIEYVLRLWSCTVSPEYGHPLKGRIRFALTPMALVDLLAIAPFYLRFTSIDLRVLRSLRLLRIVRLAKLGRYVTALRVLQHAWNTRKEQLAIVFMILSLLLLLTSSALYYAERDAQPERFSSIPASLWWAIATLSTVGYGDIYPVTALGKVFASITAILGIGMFALPAGIFGAGLVEAMHHNSDSIPRCPHCGKTLSNT